MPDDESFLRRAIRLAMHGRGHVEPNPMVGCVIVKDRRVIGEGFHAQFGGPHAEPTALAACTEDPRGATAYVTLEPCCHLNKKTPPCAPRLIEAKISRVVVGCLDPNPDVNGRGIGMLREAGIVVEGPLLENQCEQLIAPFIAGTILHRPYVTLKWAQSADGKVAGAGGLRMQISNERSMQAVHRLRSRSDAILVGVNTVLSDDPQLTARGVDVSRPIIRCVLDRHLRTPLQSKLVRSAGESRVIIGTSPEAIETSVADALRAAGVELIATHGILDFLRHLYEYKVTHLLVEAGPTLARAFFEAGLADRVWRFEGQRWVSDPTAPAAPALPSVFESVGNVGMNGDELTEYLNAASPLFFAATPSADLLLEQR